MRLDLFTDFLKNNFDFESFAQFTAKVTADLRAYVDDNAYERPYAVYVALLSQTGTDDPVAVVRDNSLNGSIAWTRNSAGIYSGTLVGAFPEDKTVVFLSPDTTSAGSNLVSHGWMRGSDDVVLIQTYLSGDPADVGLNLTAIEVRVYP